MIVTFVSKIIVPSCQCHSVYGSKRASTDRTRKSRKRYDLHNEETYGGLSGSNGHIMSDYLIPHACVQPNHFDTCVPGKVQTFSSKRHLLGSAWNSGLRSPSIFVSCPCEFAHSINTGGIPQPVHLMKHAMGIWSSGMILA